MNERTRREATERELWCPNRFAVLRAGRLVAAALLVSAAQLATGLAAPHAGAGTTTSWRASAVEGGGFQNVVAFAGAGVLLGGFDVTGLRRSTDGGLTWQPTNAGLRLHDPAPYIKVATIVRDPAAPDTFYAGMGDAKKGTGGIAVTTDRGASWQMLTTVPVFNGGMTRAPQLAEHPRETGTLIAVGEGAIWAADATRGVLRSTDRGATWHSIGLDGATIRGLAYDPRNDDLFVGVYPVTEDARYPDGGVWRNTAASASGSFSRMAQPARLRYAEEITFVNGSMWVAGGRDGLFEYANGRWTARNTGVPTAPNCDPATTRCVSWESVTGRGTTLYAGCAQPMPSGNGDFVSLLKSTDGGLTWQGLTRPSVTVSPNIVGSGRRWWLADAYPAGLLNGPRYIASDIEIDPDDPNRVVVAGKSGYWLSTDAGRSWAPSVRTLGVTSHRAVAVDPLDPARVYTANSNYGVFYSPDRMATVVNRTPGGDGIFGFDLALYSAPGATHSVVYVGMGRRDVNSGGEVFVNHDVASASSPWRSLGLATALPGGPRPLGLVVGEDGADVRTVIAAVDRTGVYRKVGSGPWTLAVGGDIDVRQPQRFVSMLWPTPQTSSVVYLYNRERGVYRSDDAGAHWSLIWAHPTNERDNTGYLAGGSRSTVYASAADGLYRIDRADSATPVVAKIATIKNVGPIVASGTDLWATTYTTGDAAATVQRTGNPTAAAPAWTLESGGFYRQAGLLPTAVDVGGGRAYVATGGDGVLVRNVG